MLSSLPAEAICANLAAPPQRLPSSETTESGTTCGGSDGGSDTASAWTFLVEGALATGLAAAEAPADAHHRLHAVVTVAGALERIKEALEVGDAADMHSSCSWETRFRSFSSCWQRSFGHPSDTPESTDIKCFPGAGAVEGRVLLALQAAPAPPRPALPAASAEGGALQPSEQGDDITGVLKRPCADAFPGCP